MKQRVLVLGASGFIGRRVVAALRESSWAVPVAAIHRSSFPEIVESVKLDAANEADLACAISNVDAVINCISGSPTTIVDTTHALLAVLSASSRSPRLVHLSSMAVYGPAIGTIDETAQVNGNNGPYAMAKVTAECIATSYGNTVVLRPGCVYGPGSAQWSVRVASWLSSRRAGDLGSSGDGICNLAYIDDVVDAVLASARLPDIAGEAFNIGSPEPPTWNEYFVSFSRVIGAVPVRRISRRRLLIESWLFAPLLKALQIFTRIVRFNRIAIAHPMSPSILRTWRQEIKLDVEKAQRVLNIRWTPLEKGLRDTAAGLWAKGLS